MTSRVVPSASGTGYEPAEAVVLLDPVSGKAFGKGGENGVTVTTNTSSVLAPAGGSFTAIQVLEDATFSAFTEIGAAGQAMTGFVVPAGITLFGRITGYTLTSGKVRAYA